MQGGQGFKRQNMWKLHIENLEAIRFALLPNELLKRQREFELAQRRLDLHFPCARDAQQQPVARLGQDIQDSTWQKVWRLAPPKENVGIEQEPHDGVSCGAIR